MLFNSILFYFILLFTSLYYFFIFISSTQLTMCSLPLCSLLLPL